MNNGYEPPTPELNTDEGFLEIGSQSECELIEESKIIADTLILRCVLRPIPLKDRNIKVLLISEGNVLQDALLYENDAITYGYDREIENSQWEGIALDYLGLGRGVHKGESFVFYGNNLPNGQIIGENPLYIKPFSVESTNQKERTTTLISGQTFVSPPGALNTRILRGYGGYYKEGVSLDDIQQIYFSLTSHEDKTRIRLFSSSLLLEQHISPPFGGKEFSHNVMFNPIPPKENYLSLSGALAAGFAKLRVSYEGGISEFSSFLGESIVGHPTYINVYFRPLL